MKLHTTATVLVFIELFVIPFTVLSFALGGDHTSVSDETTIFEQKALGIDEQAKYDIATDHDESLSQHRNLMKCASNHEYNDNPDAVKILTIIALSKESANIKHWLFYNFMLGFSKVFIVSNDCEDEAFERLVHDVERAPVPRGFVEIIGDARCVKPIPQGKAYLWVNQCIQSTWRNKLPQNTIVRTAFIDTDEYLNSADGTGILALANVPRNTSNVVLNPSYPQWSVKWRSFGTSGLEEEPKGATMLSSFVMRVPKFCHNNQSTEQALNWKYDTSARHCNNLYHGKTDFTAQPYLEKPICDADWFGQDKTNNIHFCYQGVTLKDKWERTQSVDLNKLWINHYVTRSRSEWLAKINRGRANHDGFVHIKDESKLIDYFSDKIDLNVIENVFKMCRTCPDQFKGEPKHFSECCIHQLLGARGVAKFYENSTKAVLVQYCDEDRRKLNREYHSACEFLLGSYDYSLFVAHSSKCDNMFETYKDSMATDVMKLAVTRRLKSYKTCVGSCEDLHSNLLLNIQEAKKALLHDSITNPQAKSGNITGSSAIVNKLRKISSPIVRSKTTTFTVPT